MVKPNCKQADNDITVSSSRQYGTIFNEIKPRDAEFNCSCSFEGRASYGGAHSLDKVSHSLDWGRDTSPT